MKIRLKISPDLPLPADTATATLIVYGGKGMGKTNLGGVLVEELDRAGIRFSVIDPMGVWWGLRHDEDGKGRGVEVLILGGIHGDLPITPDSGAVVADLVVDEDASVIIDISRRQDGSMWSIGERIRFVTAYVRRLYQRQGEQRRPLHQVIDEAARFAPQVVRAGELEVAQCMGAIAVLVEEGRNVGVGVTLVTQRSARLNKDVAELADCMIAFRTVGPNSRRAVLDWLGEHVDKERIKEIDAKLRSLPRGTALVVSPGWLEFEGVVPIRKRHTFDSSKTPELGKQVRASGTGAKPDLAKYRERLAEIVEEQKGNDPKTIRAELKQVRAELEKLRASKPSAPGKTVEVSVLKKTDATALAKVVDRFEERVVKLDAELQRVRVVADDLRRKVSPAMYGGDAKPVEAPRKSSLADTPYIDKRPPKPRDASRSSATDTKIVAGLRRIMIALAQRPQGLTHRQIGVRAGISTKGGTFSTYMSRARQAGWIADHGDVRKITDAGIEALGHYEPLPQGSELAAYWLRELGGGAARMLKVLIDHHPNPMDGETLGRMASVSHAGGTFSTYLSRLRGLELVSGSSKALVAAEEVCP